MRRREAGLDAGQIGSVWHRSTLHDRFFSRQSSTSSLESLTPKSICRLAATVAPIQTAASASAKLTWANIGLRPANFSHIHKKNIFFLEKQKEISFTLKSTVAFPRRHLTSIWELNGFDKLFCFVFLLNVDEELSDFCISKHLYFKRSCKATTCAQSDEPLQLPSNAASVFLLHVLNVRFLFCSVCYSNRAPRENRGFWQVFFFLRSS